MSSIEVSIPLGNEDHRAIAAEAQRRSCSEGDALKQLALERALQIAGPDAVEFAATGGSGDGPDGATVLAILEEHARRIALLERLTRETGMAVADLGVNIALLARDLGAVKCRLPEGGSG